VADGLIGVEDGPSTHRFTLMILVRQETTMTDNICTRRTSKRRVVTTRVIPLTWARVR
jgi:hypothetical protein